MKVKDGMIQKLCGIGLLAVCVALFMICLSGIGEDITAAVVLLPLGLCAFSNKKVYNSEN